MKAIKVVTIMFVVVGVALSRNEEYAERAFNSAGGEEAVCHDVDASPEGKTGASVCDGIGNFLIDQVMDTIVGMVPFLLLYLKWHLLRKATLNAKTSDWCGFEDHRSQRVFICDTFKQIGGAMWLHVANFALSEFEVWLGGGSGGCEFYWFNIMADTTIGTALLKPLLAVLKEILRGFEALDFGDYRGAFGRRIMATNVIMQTGLWVLVVSVMRAMMFFVTVLASKFHLITYLGDALTWMADAMGTLNSKLFIVRVATPLIFNTIQVFFIDEFFKCPNSTQGTGGARASSPSLEDKIQPFLQKCPSQLTLTDQDLLSGARIRRSMEGLKVLCQHEYVETWCRSNNMSKGELEAFAELEKETFGTSHTQEPADAEEVCSLEEKMKIVRHLYWLAVFFEGMDCNRDGDILPKEFARWCQRKPIAATKLGVNMNELHRLSKKAQRNALHRHFKTKIKSEGAAKFEDIIRFFVNYCSENDLDKLFGDPDGIREETPDVELPFDAEPSPPEGPSSPVGRLPKWGDDDVPEWAYNGKVADFCRDYDARHGRKGSLQSSCGFAQTDPCNQEDAPAEGAATKEKMPVVPPMEHCVGPAVPYAWCAIGINFAAMAFMPAIACATMNCKGDGFADHSSAGGFLIDVIFLLVFIACAIAVQAKIVSYTILGQLGMTGSFNLGGIINFCKFGSKGYIGWFCLMSVITTLNLLNVWTNAEVFGRVLTTYENCRCASSTIDALWAAVLQETWFGKAGPSSQILTDTTLFYLCVFLQPVFAFMFAATPDQEVDYDVGDQPFQKHDKYTTLYQPNKMAAVDHHGVVVILSSLASYEAVTFQDYAAARKVMKMCITNAKDSADHVERLAEKLSHHEQFVDAQTDSGLLVKIPKEWKLEDGVLLDTQRLLKQECTELAEAVGRYYKALQVQVQKTFVVKLVLLGLFQNALQTKVQITMFSLNYAITDAIDPLFVVGVIGNLIGYILSILDMGDFRRLLLDYFRGEMGELTGALQKENVRLSFAEFDSMRTRATRITLAYWLGIFFAILYILGCVYLLSNFIMIFRCPSHIWNIGWPPLHGCADCVRGTTCSQTRPPSSTTSPALQAPNASALWT